MRNILYTLIIIFYIAITSANAGETIRQYDSQHNITGYTTTEGGRETHFDKSWNRTGCSKDDVHYNNQHNRTGKTTWNGDTGTEFDKDENRTGHVKRRGDKETLYDRDWNRRGYKR